MFHKILVRCSSIELYSVLQKGIKSSHISRNFANTNFSFVNKVNHKITRRAAYLSSFKQKFEWYKRPSFSIPQ